MTVHGLIYGVIKDLLDEMMETARTIRSADIHAGPFTDGL
jgi:hypothetical protein